MADTDRPRPARLDQAARRCLRRPYSEVRRGLTLQKPARPFGSEKTYLNGLSDDLGRKGVRVPTMPDHRFRDMPITLEWAGVLAALARGVTGLDLRASQIALMAETGSSWPPPQARRLRVETRELEVRGAERQLPPLPTLWEHLTIPPWLAPSISVPLPTTRTPLCQLR